MNLSNFCKMNLGNSIIEIISLENRPLIGGYVTDKMMDIINSQKQNNKKTLIFYNKRWSSNVYVCRDCGYFEKCPNCDIALSYHTFPQKSLICHHCWYKNHLPYSCINCHWNDFSQVGVGIQKIYDTIKDENQNLSVAIVDSDHVSNASEIFDIVNANDVIVSTWLWSMITHDDIWAIIFALFEVNFSVPNYIIEEELYDHIAYIKKQNKPLYIQTFSPEYPLLHELVFWNYKSFLNFLKKERKKFNYPPYSDFAIIRVYHRDKKILRNLILWIYDRITGLPEELTKDLFITCDNDIYEKYHWDFMQKIILKGRGVHDVLENISSVIVKSRNIFVDWQ